MAEFRESCVTRIEGDDHIGVYTSERKYVNKLWKLKEQYPDEVKIKENPDGSLCADLPYDWFRMPQPKAKRNYTPEQREAQKERLREAREAKK